ncbi:MAG: hypothetical protein AB1716_02390 [Planctomycetota bacterium]
MNSGPAVVVKKAGFLAALVRGIFGTIMVLIVCATALTLYGMRIANNFIQALPNWRETAAPCVFDALNDRRAIEYRDSLRINTRLERLEPDGGSSTRSGEGDRGVVRIEVTNTGPEVVSLLALRVVVEDDSPARICELPMTVATPVQIEGNWRGTLLPNETRVVGRRLCDIQGDAKVTYEIADLRVWNGPRGASQPAPAAERNLPAPAGETAGL